MLERMPVFYSPKLQAQATGTFPGVTKPMQAIASWIELGIGISVIAPTPATRTELIRAHENDYVDAILGRRRTPTAVS